MTSGTFPRTGETVLVKSLPNAFAGTQLAALIRDSGRREIVIAGFAHAHVRERGFPW
jgi:nicotinamidase-related amidase